MNQNNKKVLEWTKSISVNNNIIDEQHKQLLKQIGVLEFSLRTGEANEKIEEILNFLDQYISAHLRYEEKYMIANEYYDYEEHKKLHTEFEKSFYKFKLKFYNENDDKISLAKEVEAYIYDWWINHISFADKKYANFIESKSN